MQLTVSSYFTYVFLQKAVEVDVEKITFEEMSVSVTTSASHTTSAAETMNLFALRVSLLCSLLGWIT